MALPFPSPHAALLEHAARHPHRPCLFHPEGWDWHWLSFAECVERVAAIAADLPQGSPVEPREGIDGLLLDLAVQSSIGSQADRLRSLASRTRRVEKILAFPGESEGRREILAVSSSPDDPGGQALIAWGWQVGAAMAVLPEDGGRTASAAWLRPTVFYGDAREVAELAERAAEASSGWSFFKRFSKRRRPSSPRPPLGRLRAVLWRGPAAPEPEVGLFWSEHGVRLLAMEEVLSGS